MAVGLRGRQEMRHVCRNGMAGSRSHRQVIRAGSVAHRKRTSWCLPSALHQLGASLKWNAASLQTWAGGDASMCSDAPQLLQVEVCKFFLHLRG